LFRIQMSSPQAAAESIVSVIASRNDWVGHFSVVDEDRIRLIPLPPT
jgi:hypothetical protein